MCFPLGAYLPQSAGITPARQGKSYIQLKENLTHFLKLMLSLEAFPTCFLMYHLALWRLRKPGPLLLHPVTRCHNQIHKRRGDAPQGSCQPRLKERNSRGHLEKLKSVPQGTCLLWGVNKYRTVNKGDQSQTLSLLEVPVWRI